MPQACQPGRKGTIADSQGVVPMVRSWFSWLRGLPWDRQHLAGLQCRQCQGPARCWRSQELAAARRRSDARLTVSVRHLPARLYNLSEPYAQSMEGVKEMSANGPKTRTISFDAYGTLLCLDNPFERMQQNLAQAGVPAPLETVQAAFARPRGGAKRCVPHEDCRVDRPGQVH